ncbi:hypothetical protein ANN_14077 [Periplaneta americana]|uniref:Uncharacterized protein n=1 Tax=Periplaneta americana TaxID=6978 RepID=A0ABQ8SWI6_PERAM|nr:hypothetical protein ANN_14077 [Periplaneta americana]
MRSATGWFLWNRQILRVPRDQLTLAKSQGGLGVFDPYTKALSLFVYRNLLHVQGQGDDFSFTFFSKWVSITKLENPPDLRCERDVLAKIDNTFGSDFADLDSNHHPNSEYLEDNEKCAASGEPTEESGSRWRKVIRANGNALSAHEELKLSSSSKHQQCIPIIIFLTRVKEKKKVILQYRMSCKSAKLMGFCGRPCRLTPLRYCLVCSLLGNGLCIPYETFRSSVLSNCADGNSGQSSAIHFSLVLTSLPPLLHGWQDTNAMWRLCSTVSGSSPLTGQHILLANRIIRTSAEKGSTYGDDNDDDDDDDDNDDT